MASIDDYQNNTLLTSINKGTDSNRSVFNHCDNNRKKRSLIEWKLLGVFPTVAEMTAVRSTGRVSKRKTDHLRMGTKVTYRCNRFKKTRCRYQMYALYQTDGYISLFETGKHEHNAVHNAPQNIVKNEVDDSQDMNIGCQSNSSSNSNDLASPPTMVTAVNSATAALFSSLFNHRPLTPATTSNDNNNNNNNKVGNNSMLPTSSAMTQLYSQPQYGAEIPLNMNFVRNTIENDYYSAIKMETVIDDSPMTNNGHKSPNHSSSYHPNFALIHQDSRPYFALSEGHNVSQLMRLASDLNLVFSFNTRRHGEYCFERNTHSSNSDQKLLVVSDLGGELRVSERLGSQEIDVELWTKADWRQFLWALRGKCTTTLNISS